jgi:4-hydroxy-3-methylbut-2-enyl diphosphate reductase
MAYETISSSPGPVFILGDLVHNPQVIKELESQGVTTIDSIDEIEQGTVIIRAHGVPPEVIEAAKAKGLTVVDATCPSVSRVHKIASKLKDTGHTVVVVGEHGHPEVVGTSAHAGDKAIVAQSPDDLLPNDFPTGSHVGVVAQTTQTDENFNAIVDALRNTGIKLNDKDINNTICNATQERQRAVGVLAAMVEVMIIIGGRKSSNTEKLFRISSIACKTYHIESPDELKPEWFTEVKLVGVATGASTPEKQIAATEERLSAI